MLLDERPVCIFLKQADHELDDQYRHRGAACHDDQTLPSESQNEGHGKADAGGRHVVCGRKNGGECHGCQRCVRNIIQERTYKRIFYFFPYQRQRESSYRVRDRCHDQNITIYRMAHFYDLTT